MVGPSIAGPIPAQNAQIFKVGNSLFMAGSENLERYWKRPGRESKRWKVRERERIEGKVDKEERERRWLDG